MAPEATGGQLPRCYWPEWPKYMYSLFLSSRRRNTEPKPKHAYIKVCAGFDNNVDILSNDIHQNLRHCNPCWSTWRPVISNQSVHMCEFALNSSCVLTASKLGECGQKIDMSGPFTPLDDMARSVSRDRSLRRQMTWQGRSGASVIRCVKLKQPSCENNEPNHTTNSSHTCPRRIHAGFQRDEKDGP